VTIAALILAAVAVAVGGWIGYRATETHPESHCFLVPESSAGIACVDPARMRESYRVVYLDPNGPGVKSEP
jgi:hypothetical protein